MENNINKSLAFKWTILCIISLTIFGCGKNESDKLSQTDEEKIIKECLGHLIKTGSQKHYLVSSKFEKFDFNVFFKKNGIFELYDKNYDYEKKNTKF